MKKLKSILPFLIINGFLLTACTANVPKTNTNTSSTVTTNSTVINSASTSSQASQTKASETTKAAESKTSSENIAQKTKGYILNGQGDKPEAGKLLWSETFLNKVDFDSVYKKYISDGGKAGDIESFAKYLTQNAPVPDNWKELFEADLLKTYGQTVSRYEKLQDNLYQAYIKIDGSEVPYVAVNTRTGYFHG